MIDHDKKPTRLPESFTLSIYSLVNLEKDDLIQTSALRNNFNALSNQLTDGSHSIYYENTFMYRVKSMVKAAFPSYDCSLTFFVTESEDMLVDVTVICKGNETTLVKGTIQ